MKSVEDEWTREIESDEDLDLLFIAYYSDKTIVKELIAKIEEHGFKAEVKD